MSREWEPGDVAMVRLDSDTEIRVFRERDGWRGVKGTFYDLNFSARPLVVIDPESREEVERLIRLRWPENPEPTPVSVEKWQAALREFANPKPPKPPEPTGRYAVVKDAAGDEWVRTAEGPPAPWLRSGYFTAERWTDYADIDAVRVLSEGIQP